MHRFFAFKKDKIYLEEEELKHFKVLRILQNEIIELILENHIYRARYFDGDFELLEDITRLPDKKVFLNVCIPIKLKTFEIIIDYAVEGGVFEITPLICRRGFQDVDKVLEKYDRFRKILKEAIKQSRPSFLPTLNMPINLSDVSLKEYNVLFDSFEKPKTKILKAKEYSAVVGPEGGLSKEESAYLTSKGFVKHSLGDNILREELAVFGAVFTLNNLI